MTAGHGVGSSVTDPGTGVTFSPALTKAHTVALSAHGPGQEKTLFAYTQPAPDRLTLDGTMERHKIHMELRLFDRSQFLLLSRGFHWVSPSPFNR